MVEHPVSVGGPAQGAADERSRASNHLTRCTLAFILAGGRGSRLKQLTDWRAKPALPFAGKLKLIDFPLSNCVNSGIRRIAVLTQYKAQSLIRHIERGWGFLSPSLAEFIDVVPAQQQVGECWYTGTADALFQNLDLVREADAEHVLILAGDHVYKMDYTVMLADHVAKGADVTVACIEVPLADAMHFGVMAVDADGRVTAFQEKPVDPKPLPGRSDRVLASMGIYVFGAALLGEQLARDATDPASSHDFGKDLIPRLLQEHRVLAHRFADSCVNMVEGRPYWRDVGTIDAYWEANMDLTQTVPELNLYDEHWPILSLQPQLPPAKFVFDDDWRRGTAIDSLVSSGCIVSGATVRRSILFANVRVAEGSLIEDSLVLPDVVIGQRVTLRRTIVDKRCVLPDGFKAGLHPAEDAARFHVTERGVVLITPEMIGQSVHTRAA
ncbi:MAG: glucose-1-phosphate adenylyltransferase [Burkholderiaceae bacterium]|nr:glucose-1-phosphate adenylyltransferase [Burkholderiaceae bacterium]